jgi:bifunctional non-homologous end joining protein LigD
MSALAKTSRSDIVGGVRISHPDRIIYSHSATTKLDVAEYYYSVSRWMVPHVKGRPLTLVHCPEGLAGACRFMKHSKLWGPDTLRRVRIREKKKIGEYMVADDARGLVGLAQMGILEVHTWNSTTDDIERPNRIVFDLDPGDRVEWPKVVASAKLVRRVLSAIGLESYPKTTGGKGLHIVVPLVPQADWSECLEFSRDIAAAIERNDPDLFTTKFAKEGRESKILIDYLRNNRTNTSIAAYSTRAREGATVSFPITWRDVRESLNPLRFTIDTVVRRLARMRSDPWRSYWSSKQKLTTMMMKAVDLV